MLSAMALAVAGLAQAALFDDDEARRRIEDLRVEQARSARETAERLSRVEERVRNIGVVELLGQVEELKTEIARLRGELEVLVNQNEQIQKRQRDFYLDLDSRIKRLEGAGGSARAPAPPLSGTLPEEPGATDARAAANGESAREVRSYDTASGLFRRNDFAAAAEAFRAFLREFPQSTLAPNATYWIGICLANLKDFPGALASQERLLARYPQSPKAPDALLAIASVQSELGDTGSARNTLEDLIARYPSTEAAGKARTRLGAIRR